MSYRPPPQQALGHPPSGLRHPSGGMPPGMPPPGNLPTGMVPPPPFPGPPGFPPPPLPPPVAAVPPPTLPSKPPISVPGVPPLAVPPGIPLLPTPSLPTSQPSYRETKHSSNNYQNQNQGNSSATAITVFVGNITERASDALVRQILTVCLGAFVPLFISIHLLYIV